MQKLATITRMTIQGRVWELIEDARGELVLIDEDEIPVAQYDGGLAGWSTDEYEGCVPRSDDDPDNPYNSPEHVRDLIHAGELSERMDDLLQWMRDRAIEEGRVSTAGETLIDGTRLKGQITRGGN